VAGTRSSRTRVTSTTIATAIPTPMILTMMLGSAANPAATAIMMAAAQVITFALDASPSMMLCQAPDQFEVGGVADGRHLGSKPF
jgi:hypothetical protein